MRFIFLVQATKETEAGAVPTEEMLATVAEYHEELARAASGRRRGEGSPAAPAAEVPTDVGTLDPVPSTGARRS